MKMLLVAALFVAGAVQAKTITLSGKKVNWKGEKIVGDAHVGNVKISKGTLKLNDSKKIESGMIVVDMNTINTTDLKGEWKAKLDGHLKNEDFYNVKKYKTSTLKIKKVMPTKAKNNTVDVFAELTIKGITKPVNFSAVQTEKKFKGDLVFDRTQFGIKYASGNFFKLAADKTIKDNITLTFDFNL